MVGSMIYVDHVYRQSSIGSFTSASGSSVIIMQRGSALQNPTAQYA
jgi:hypothetical protein